MSQDFIEQNNRFLLFVICILNTIRYPLTIYITMGRGMALAKDSCDNLVE
jgi:hypothetical protein